MNETEQAMRNAWTSVQTMQGMHGEAAVDAAKRVLRETATALRVAKQPDVITAMVEALEVLPAVARIRAHPDRPDPDDVLFVQRMALNCVSVASRALEPRPVREARARASVDVYAAGNRPPAGSIAHEVLKVHEHTLAD